MARLRLRILITTASLLFVTYLILRSQNSAIIDSSSNSQRDLPNYTQLFQLYKDQIKYVERGIWKGAIAGKYHALHYGPGLASRLVEFFHEEEASSVVDFGGGSGQHVRELMSSGIFATCYDGNPDSQEASNGTCSPMDLTKPLQLSQYDWVLSLSVGRQIPVDFVPQFVTNIHNLNRRGVVIYWGDYKPDRKNIVSRVRNNSEVIKLFTNLGYVNDEVSSLWLRGDVPPKDSSVLVFRKMIGREEEIDYILPQSLDSQEPIQLAVTSCGMARLDEAITMIKTAIMFSRHTRLYVNIFTDEEGRDALIARMEQLAVECQSFHPGFGYDIHLASFPPDIDGMAPWKDVFKSCSLLRLFLPSLLPEVDSLIYLDADALILSNLTNFWSLFKEMNETQLVGLSELTEVVVKPWYIQHPEIPHYGVRGLNCGIALMNLTKMRLSKFEDKIIEMRKRYESSRPTDSGDQFLQNVLYSFHPEFVYTFPCNWNLRNMHCNCWRYESCGCKSAMKNGVGLIHGTGSAFTKNGRRPLFQHVYETIKSFQLNESMGVLVDNLIEPFRNKGMGDRCFFNSSRQMFRNLERYAVNLLREQ